MLKKITAPYFLCINIPVYCDEDGRRYLPRLWYKDLKTHLDYIENFSLACPCVYGKPPGDTTPLDADPAFSRIRIIDLPQASGFIDAIRLLPSTIVNLWHEIGCSKIIHTSVAGWPIPFGWIITPMLYLRKRFYIIIIESAPWRINTQSSYKLKDRIRAFLSEKISLWCIAKADFVVCTSNHYKNTFLRVGFKGKSCVIPASWVDESDIISEADAAKSWMHNLSKTPRFLFAARLIPSKGVYILLRAMELLNAENIPISIDILGDGKLLEECQKLAGQLTGRSQMSVIGTVPYGADFFRLLRSYCAVIVPSLSDEQPRIIFDAYSQAIPVFVSDTPGPREYVQDLKTGRLFSANNAQALANVIKWAIQYKAELQPMGMASLKVAQNMTHKKMHETRWELLLKALEGKIDHSSA